MKGEIFFQLGQIAELCGDYNPVTDSYLRPDPRYAAWVEALVTLAGIHGVAPPEIGNNGTIGSRKAVEELIDAGVPEAEISAVLTILLAHSPE